MGGSEIMNIFTSRGIPSGYWSHDRSLGFVVSRRLVQIAILNSKIMPIAHLDLGLVMVYHYVVPVCLSPIWTFRYIQTRQKGRRTPLSWRSRYRSLPNALSRRQNSDSGSVVFFVIFLFFVVSWIIFLAVAWLGGCQDLCIPRLSPREKKGVTWE